jgi:predicted unusual protein kinase regulating ubiquinone biosynthesis (AarF/ABC1/UbiB family)
VPLRPSPPSPAQSLEDVLGPMPRRAQLLAPTGTRLRLPDVSLLAFDAGLIATFARLWAWVDVSVRLALAIISDAFTGDRTPERRARRLREALERVGGTFVKLGQQVAMRIDVLPWAYCVEFSKMLDRMPPFPLEQALAAVDRAIGRPWQEVFEVFDPEPIGAASIACVYQATLKDGTHVAVKIRRPGIGEAFAADFRVLDWICKVVEGLALVRPGFTGNLRRELRETLMEELDLRREAQFQHAFRDNAARRSRRTFFTAPRVHFALSNDAVLVQDFVPGMFLSELIAAVEQGDPEGHAMMRRLNIDPALVGRRILWAAFWSIDENLFFHADPHPANIIVGQDSTITFIDFGSCGAFNEEQRSAFERIGNCMRRDDAEGMTRATLKLLEPLPPVDLAALMKQAQGEYVRVLYTFRTKARHTEWWERTSAHLWLAMIRIARQYNLPISLGTLRMIRATLLYDTIVLRLDRTINRYDEYERFREDRARFARERWRRRVRDAREQFLLRVDEWDQASDEVLERVQHALSVPTAGFSALIEKSVFTVTTMTRLVGRVVVLTALATAWVAAGAYRASHVLAPAESLATVLDSAAWQLATGTLALLSLRQVLFRLRERDVRRETDRAA